MEAKDFAAARHSNQMWGPHPYIEHLVRVATRAQMMWAGPRPDDIVAAAYLHDVLEDTATTPEELTRLFGERVAALVVAVTDAPGRTRRVRHAGTYPKIAAAGDAAVFLKLCDRYVNWRQCIDSGDSRLRMYRREYGDFRKALRNPAVASPSTLAAWNDLDDLFRIPPGLLARPAAGQVYYDAKMDRHLLITDVVDPSWSTDDGYVSARSVVPDAEGTRDGWKVTRSGPSVRGWAEDITRNLRTTFNSTGLSKMQLVDPNAFV
jgi:hypothetical protein